MFLASRESGYFQHLQGPCPKVMLVPDLGFELQQPTIEMRALSSDGVKANFKGCQRTQERLLIPGYKILDAL